MGQIGWLPESNPVVHARVYAVAQKYQVTALKSLALRRYRAALQNRPDFDEFLDSVAEVYTSTGPHDRGLRDIVVQFWAEHQEELDGSRGRTMLHRLMFLSDDISMVLADQTPVDGDGQPANAPVYIDLT